MSYHLVAFRSSLVSVALTDLAAVQDSIMTIQNGHFVPQEDRLIPWIYAQGLLADEARIINPTIRQFTRPRILPLNLGDGPITEPRVADYRQNPFRVKGLEELAAEIGTTGAGPSNAVVAVALARGPLTPAPSGDIYTLHGSSVTAVVANAWTQLTVTFDDTLPQGTYTCVGAVVQSATAILSRIIFDDQVDRPGSVGMLTLTARPSKLFLKGGLGAWGRFTSNRFPNVEVFAGAADAAHEVFIDFVRSG